MKTARTGKRHPLLMYRRTMDRVCIASLGLGIALGGLWASAEFSPIPLVQVENSRWLLAATGLILLFATGGFLGRSMAYVQARQDHLRLITPFLHLRISYRRMRSVHPTVLQQLFPPHKASWSQHRFLSPFYGDTVLVIDLQGYPLSPIILRLFLAPQMLSQKSPELVLLVPDWMALSSELDSLRAIWQNRDSRARIGRSQ